ncbi:Ankyrin repeat domain-containing protein 26 [Fukomys damarensis]|uniref:Beta-microseminoprotein n=1 Tax=Fukomys damarensis TaxID=885580 RepID=A0A091DB18_FUKDA|nr:Ankyrin repeat domain-containing protein 26 [Fukomys damarensis]
MLRSQGNHGLWKKVWLQNTSGPGAQALFSGMIIWALTCNVSDFDYHTHACKSVPDNYGQQDIGPFLTCWLRSLRKAVMTEKGNPFPLMPVKVLLGSLLVLAAFKISYSSQCCIRPTEEVQDESPAECTDEDGIMHPMNSSWITEKCEECYCLKNGIQCYNNCGDPQHRARPKAVGKVHKAASVGHTAKVEQRLMLRKSGVNDRDKKHRTALHFACIYGHPEVVTLLVEKKCDIDAHDRENSTALIKDDLTPHSIAVRENKQQVEELLIKEKENIHALDEPGRFSNKRDPFDSSEGDDDNFDDMNLPKVNLAELWAAAHQSGEKRKLLDKDGHSCAIH